MQHLQTLNMLEERIQKAVELISHLKGEKSKLEEEAARLNAGHKTLQERLDTLNGEKEQLVEQERRLRAQKEEWTHFERDREEIRSRIDGMLAKFEELEI